MGCIDEALVAERVERVDDALHAGPVEHGDRAAFSSAKRAWARTLPDLQPMVARRFMARGSKEVFFLAPIELSPAAMRAKFLPFCE